MAVTSLKAAVPPTAIERALGKRICRVLSNKDTGVSLIFEGPSYDKKGKLIGTNYTEVQTGYYEQLYKTVMVDNDHKRRVPIHKEFVPCGGQLYDLNTGVPIPEKDIKQWVDDSLILVGAGDVRVGNEWVHSFCLSRMVRRNPADKGQHVSVLHEGNFTKDVCFKYTRPMFVRFLTETERAQPEMPRCEGMRVGRAPNGDLGWYALRATSGKFGHANDEMGGMDD